MSMFDVQVSRSELCTHLMGVLFAHSREWISKVKADLAKTNMDRQGVKSPAKFMYRNSVYSPIAGTCHTIKLHPSLRDEVVEVNRLQKQLMHEQNTMRNYLGTLLLRCRTRTDLKAMLPDALWERLPQNFRSIPKEDMQTVRSAQISEFKAVYRSSEEMVMQRMVKNLIER